MKQSDIINWDELTGNSSECDALCDFARGGHFTELCRNIWSREAKRELAKLKKKTVKQARITVKRGIQRYYILD